MKASRMVAGGDVSVAQPRRELMRWGGGASLMKRRGCGGVGQGTLEYILLIAAVIVALLVGINAFKGGVNSMVDNSSNVINSASNKFTTGMKLNSN